MPPRVSEPAAVTGAAALAAPANASAPAAVTAAAAVAVPPNDMEPVAVAGVPVGAVGGVTILDPPPDEPESPWGTPYRTSVTGYSVHLKYAWHACPVPFSTITPIPALATEAIVRSQSSKVQMIPAPAAAPMTAL